jgi:hypothetical protein
MKQQTLVIRRAIAAPREQIFDYLTSPEKMAKWFYGMDAARPRRPWIFVQDMIARLCPNQTRWFRFLKSEKEFLYVDALSAKNVRLKLSGNSPENGEGFSGRGLERKVGSCKKVSTEVVGTRVLLRLSFFACDILRSSLPHVSSVKSTSAPLRC